jgi:hypothetical protein
MQAAKRTRNVIRPKLLRAMKLGDETVDKLKGTSLASAAEMDALVFLNLGAPSGKHTNDVKQLLTAAEAGEKVSAVAVKNGATLPRDDIGADSRVEAERLRVRVEELQAQIRQRDIRITGLEDEIEDLKAAAKSAAEHKPASRCSICHEKKRAPLRPVFICDGCVDIHEIREAAPRPDDGLDIPKSLRRDKHKEMTQ